MPALANIAAYMKSFMQKAPAIDKYGFVQDFQWKPKVIAKTAAYTVLVKESGTIFTTTGATAAVTFTLPAIDAGDGTGWIFYFMATADVGMTVTAETADTMITFNDAAADSVAFSTASEIMGGAFMVFSDGTSLHAIPMGAGGHVQTLTVTTA